MKKITVFTTNTCAYCVMVKKYLTAKGFTYDTVNLDEHPNERERVARYTNALTVPITLIEVGTSNEVVIGWKPAQLIPALIRYDSA